MEQKPKLTLAERKHESLESVLASIMSAEEYSHIEHPVPYIFELKVDGCELYYFGTPHISDPQSPIFSEIATAFQKVNPDIVIVEGIPVPEDKTILNKKVQSVTCEEVIFSAGESGFTLKLGIDNGIDWHSPEPTDENLYEYLLLQGFSKEEIFTWEVFHIFPQYQRQMKRDGFKKYVEPFLKGFEEATGWEGFDFTYEHALQFGEQIFGEAIDVENDQNALDRIDPIPWEGKKEKQTVLNRIGAASTHFRDRKIVSDIAEAKKTHKRIFIVYGASHAAMQEPALRKLFSQT